jgi:DNA-binding XRE family transcriptional regulator
MPNIGAAIREEITRLSRRETRSQLGLTRKATVQHRHDIASLKRKIAQLERQIALVSRKLPGALTPSTNGAPATRVRFVPKGLRSQRERLGMSQNDLAKLLGVSGQTIYNWEHEVARPRSEQIVKIVAMRGWGKREAAARLEQLAAGNGTKRRKAG